MKIVHVVPTVSNMSAGTTQAVMSISEAQANLGHEVSVVALEANNSYTPYSESVSVIICERNKFLWKLGISRSMKVVLNDLVEGADVVHAHMLWMQPFVYAYSAAIKHNVKFVCSPHGALTNYGVKRSVLKKFLVKHFFGHRSALRGVDMFHVTSDMEEQELIGNIGSVLVANLPLGIKGADKSNYEKYRDKTILYLSRIHEKKGLDILISSYKLLPEKTRKEWGLLIVGPEDQIKYTEKVKNMARGVDGIKFLGEVHGEPKNEILAKSHVFVLPTHSENFGLVVGEALCMGTPVLCSKGAPWGILETNDIGWWEDLDVFPRALSSICDLDKDKLIEMGARAKKFGQYNLSDKVVGSKLVCRYEELVDVKI